MIQIFRGAQAPGLNPILDAMHRDRKHVFVDLLKWDVPVVGGSFEIDQFDDERAIYLVAADANGEHRGSIRLLPTDGPHILGTIFPELCDEAVPCSPEIYEISRGCLSTRLRPPERLVVRNALTTAAVEFALLNHIRAFTCIADSGWLSQVLALGWDCWPLGLPRKIGRSLTGALRISISPETPHLLRDAGTYVSAPITFADFRERAIA
jgi:acyl-homoserine lactone synthase